MFRKILSVILGLLFILGSFVLFIDAQSDYLVREMAKQDSISKNFTHFNLPNDIKGDQEYREVLDVLNKTSEQEHVNYAKLQIFNGFNVNASKQTLNYARPSTKLNYQVFTVKPTSIWSYFGKQKSYVNDTFTFKNGIKGYTASITPINKNISYDGRQGTFYVETKSVKEYNLFITKLKDNYNFKFGKQYKTDDFKTNRDYDEKRLEIDVPSFSNLNQALFSILAIFVVLYILLSTKYIAVYRLAGLSTFRMVFNLFKSFFLIVFVGMSGLIGYLLLIKKWHIGLTPYMQITAILMCLLVLAAVIVYLLNYLSFNSQLKNKNYLNWSFYLVYLVKAIALIMVFSNLIPLFQLATSMYNSSLRTTYGNRKVGNEYGVIYPHLIGYDTDQHTLADSETLDNELYSFMNKKGGIIFDGSSNEDYQTGPEYIKSNIVNPNYLRRFPIKDINGQKIHEADSEKKILLILPLSEKNSVDKREKYIEDTEYENIGKKPVIQVVFVPNSEKYFNLTEGKYKDITAMFVTTKYNSGFINRDMMNSQGNRDALKIPISKSEKQTYLNLSDSLEKYNYADNYLQVVKLNNLDFEDVKRSVGDVVQASISLSLTLMFILFITVYLVVLYFRSNSKKIYYKYMAGYSTMRILVGLWCLIILQYVFLFLINFMENQIDVLSTLSIMTMFIVEVICVLITSKILTNNLLKGNK
ncbi:hypothetical protein JOC36_000907 [Weissella uvarum]|uniref:hypothetical protein n=1 Tax=Weissella uvarum TaxID=1479233 RepID=UPI001961CD3E|nr:hypothetical protein [Weissella uvarum]MBM7617350.1 hypothetical protein [Weissella uvarum]MCM0595762.1 hypothetical protein [Weissella uvarum]